MSEWLSKLEWVGWLGWLSPDGVHYPCRWQDHDQYAYRVMGKRVADLEADGWCRVTVWNGALDPLLGYGQALTEAQAEWLLNVDAGGEA